MPEAEMDQFAGLPAPVRRYFEFALTPGQPLVEAARLEHAGEFAARPGRWSPFTSVEQFTVQPPGFVWDARIRMWPLAAVTVRDSYSRGEGAMLVKLAGLIPMVDRRGTPELASGALMRYLAEAAWLPTALLPASGVAWEALDERSARATLVDSGVRVSLNFHFGAQGGIRRVTGDRFRDVEGRGVLTRWEGEFSDYRRVEGMMIPHTGEVAWALPDARMPYWRGRILAAAYKFDGRGGHGRPSASTMNPGRGHA
jgi:hypothetical protein